MRLALVAFAVVLFGCGSRKTAGLSESVAAGLLEEAWRSTDEVLPLGEVQIVRSNSDMTRRQVQQPALAWYDALLKEGVISISQGTSRTGRRQFSRDAFLLLSQQGALERLVVERKSQGDSLYRCSPNRLKSYGLDDALCVSHGSGKIQEIVSSEQFLIGTSAYFFMGNYRWKWSPTALRAFSTLKEDISEDRKFMAIAAYDPLLKKWTLADVDYAPRTGTFPRQQHFEQFLSPTGLPRLSDPPGR